jgi:hypothetical protein
MQRLFAARKYKSGTGWGVWRWTETPSNYLLRLHLIKAPFGALMIHWLLGPDPEEDLHDHPASLLSLILRGGYTELRKRRYVRQARVVRHRWVNFIRAAKTDRHRIVSVLPHTTTLCIVGPKVREWGFHTPSGWTGWRAYNEKYMTGEKIHAIYS